MSYIVFARKWRPKTFEEVIGQEHITTTLKNAIEQDRVAHAYLFCGPRGTGKTTTARLLAKALNCEKGPTPNPCNKCFSCEEITQARSMDIIEIDAASNRGIEEIRSLRESVKFSPQYGRYKVYIVDEVHMLTNDAFNALLKTLEEPPSHIKFILATTAGHRLLPTILSRCQRFDFKRIPTNDIISKLKKITEKEKINAEEAAIFAIAKAASGSMRDAESILDQMNSFSKGKISLSDVNTILGLVSQQALHEFAECIIKKDTALALQLVDKIMNDGKDAYQFMVNLLEHFRNVLIAKQGKDLNKLMDLLPEDIETISKQADSFTIEDVLYVLYTMINTQASLRYAPSVRIPLEMLAVKLTRRESIVSLAEILKRIAALEKMTSDEAKTETVPAAPQARAQGNTLQQPHEIKTLAATENKNYTEGEGLHSDPASLYKLREIWPQVIGRIKLEKVYLASCLEAAQIVEFKDNILTLGYAKNDRFHKEIMERAQNKKLIETTVSELLNSKIGIESIISDKIKNASGDKTSQVSDPDASPTVSKKDSIKKALSDPIIQSALDIFDGTIMKFM